MRSAMTSLAQLVPQGPLAQRGKVAARAVPQGPLAQQAPRKEASTQGAPGPHVGPHSRSSLVSSGRWVLRHVRNGRGRRLCLRLLGAAEARQPPPPVPPGGGTGGGTGREPRKRGGRRRSSIRRGSAEMWLLRSGRRQRRVRKPRLTHRTGRPGRPRTTIALVNLVTGKSVIATDAAITFMTTVAGERFHLIASPHTAKLVPVAAVPQGRIGMAVMPQGRIGMAVIHSTPTTHSLGQSVTGGAMPCVHGIRMTTTIGVGLGDHPQMHTQMHRLFLVLPLFPPNPGLCLREGSQMVPLPPACPRVAQTPSATSSNRGIHGMTGGMPWLPGRVVGENLLTPTMWSPAASARM